MMFGCLLSLVGWVERERNPPLSDLFGGFRSRSI